MHTSRSPIIRRALFVDGTFCIVVGLLLAVSASWLESELPVSGAWVIVAAGLVTTGWGALLLAASRYRPTRWALVAVAIVNVSGVVAVLVWLVQKGDEMSGIGLAVAGILGISVLRFAIYQVLVLRQ